MKLVKLLFAVIAILVVTSVTFSNHSLDDSQLVSDLSQEILALEKENTILRAEIADAGSLTFLNAKVEAMGFVAVPKVVTLNAGNHVASR